MTAWNVVRFRVKPGREEEFLAAHRAVDRGGFKGMRRFSMFKTGDNGYCVIGEWQSMKNLVDARPQMIGTLDTFRDCLEELGGGLGVTDPVSGEGVMEMAPKSAKKSATRKAPKKKTAEKSKAPKRKASKKSRR
jgi:hypothetical protein